MILFMAGRSMWILWISTGFSTPPMSASACGHYAVSSAVVMQKALYLLMKYRFFIVMALWIILWIIAEQA